MGAEQRMAEQGMARGARKGKHRGAFRVITQYGDLVMRYSWAWVYGNVTQYMGHGTGPVSSGPVGPEAPDRWFFLSIASCLI